jgi:hypothetical protein
MHILILGGSNSLMRGSYLNRALDILERNSSKKPAVLNHSVGATTTFTALARIFDLPAGYAPDLVIYEYALNDTSHFNGLASGAEVQGFAIGLLVDLLARRFPDAALAPVLFGLRALFSSNSTSPIHAAQTQIWTDAKIPHLDVRRQLAHIFANKAPDWLYSDVAHYSAPHGTDIVGSMVGRFLVELMLGGRSLPMREIAARMRTARGPTPFALKALDAADLAKRVSGDWELVTRANRLMSVQALRLRAGATLNLPAKPLNIALLSDRQHDLAQLIRRTPTRDTAWSLMTRNIFVDGPSLNPPDRDRFFYSGIPLPLLLSGDTPLDAEGSDLQPDDAPFELHIPIEPDDTLPPLAFDGFVRQPARAEQRRMDIVSALFLEPA